MRTPVVMTLGMVLTPCGLLLNLVSTLAPGWRLLKGFRDQPVDVVLYQGLWDICREQSSRERECGQPDQWNYFGTQPVQVARGLMITSLATTALGLLLASLGVRCWQEEPHFGLAGLSGVVLFAAGLFSLIPVSWYNHFLADPDVLAAPAQPVTVQVSYSLVLGYLGSCLLLLGGFSLALSFAPWCEERCCRCRKAPPAGPRRSSISTVYVDWPEPALTPAIKYYSEGQHRPPPAQQRDTGKLKVGFPMPRPPPKAYTNPMDVLEGEEKKTASSQDGSSSRSTRPCQNSLPCDSDL
ncbi:claudin 23 [Rattus norvegicus]|uniref:Claudin 23 n=2 Tax=Rattus norvegicus TaxID=10116 RepID=A6IVM1_RAT|nr:claudin-23 [Rattus norvegicus]AAI00631.1 Claudin 23 [Rattus norvegicus]EDM09201.1 claudin 23 [Rattus norvegicus]|eukprot:NP_001028234.1 claudin-23 [Rattus norvegicus]